MRSTVQSFPVEVHDTYATARASMTSPRRRIGAKVWGLTAGAVLLGAGLGWSLAVVPANGPLTPISGTAPSGETATIEASGAAPVAAVERAPASAGTTAIETVTGWLGIEALDSAAVPPLGAAAWPITLHRAGDGDFYADLSLDGYIVNARIDPNNPRSILGSTDMPGGPTLDGAEWQASDVVLEHLRLPAMRFAVSSDPTAATVIGGDLLAAFFTIEQRIDRLRLIPRAG